MGGDPEQGSCLAPPFWIDSSGKSQRSSIWGWGEGHEKGNKKMTNKKDNSGNWNSGDWNKELDATIAAKKEIVVDGKKYRLVED